MGDLIIRRPKSVSINTRWIAVVFDGNKFESQKWVKRNEGDKRLLCFCSNIPYMFWQEVIGSIHRGETFWVAGWKIYEFACWSGLYERVKAGDIKLTTKCALPNGASKCQESSKLIGALICENPPTIIDGELRNGGRVKFVDLANYGLKPEMFCDSSGPPILDDVIQAIQDFTCMLHVLDMGQLKQTAASQGWYCYRRSHMYHDIFPDTNPDVRKLERSSYFAGRCEVFRIGKLPGKIWHLDVTSMYASIGLIGNFPTKLKSFNPKPSGEKSIKDPVKMQYIADVTLATKQNGFPVRYNNKVMYPFGEFRTVLPWPELLTALALGIVTDIHSVSEYECQPIFASFSKWYFDSLHSLEMLGLAHIKQSLKSIVNATWGKIGQRSKTWVDVPKQVPRAKWDQWFQRHPKYHKPVQYRSLDGVVQYLDSGIESPISMPSISATMSSYGRVAINNIMALAGKGNVYYVDTDGIMVNETGYNLLCGLGMVKEGTPGLLRVREQSSDVEIFGIKHYRFGERYCCAGIPDDCILNVDKVATYQTHAPFNDGLWHRTAFEHRYHRRTQKRRRYYEHGFVGKDGIIEPWIMRDITDEHTRNGSYQGDGRKYAIMGSAIDIT